MRKSLISIITPTFNEKDNVEALGAAVDGIMSQMQGCNYEQIFIDNASTDGTPNVLKRMAKKDKRIKVILNTRNFGHIRSPYHALMQCGGDAAAVVAADFQDPPILLKDFIKEWQKGYKVVIGIKNKSRLNPVKHFVSTIYYKMLRKLTDVPLIENYMGFGLFDREVLETMREMDDCYPYMRGLIADMGYEPCKVYYTQPKRNAGTGKNNIRVLFDMAMLGITNNTKVPLRLATIMGFAVSVLSFLIGFAYFIIKLANWQNFELGLAPLVTGVFFLGGIQLLFLGIIGEYVGATYTQVMHRPLVIEKERINFG